jgi:hypothetical protein
MFHKKMPKTLPEIVQKVLLINNFHTWIIWLCILLIFDTFTFSFVE